jgi:carboxymethylenebutenolidase
MIANEVIVPTKYGNVPTFAACPEGPGDHFLRDAPGIREELRNMARRIAKQPEADKITAFPVSYLG